MKKFLVSAMLLGALALSGAEVVFDGSAPDKWQDGKAQVKDGALQLKASYSMTLSKDFVTIDRSKKYTISGEFRILGSYSGKYPILYFGFIPYTADGKEIIHAAIAPVTPAIAPLAADAKKGDKEIKIKVAQPWKLLGHGRLAFNVKADRSDLPNLDLSPFFDMAKCKAENGVQTIALKTPLAKDYPAGTMVRQHRSGNMFVYAGWDNKPGEWMTFNAPVNNFYIGTAKIKPAFRLLTRDGLVEVRNVKFTAL